MRDVGGYLQAFSALEAEINALSYSILFDDNQINTYSMKIAELVMRSGIELESVANDIFRGWTSEDEIKNDDGAAEKSFAWLKKSSGWKLEQKQISILSPSMFFSRTFSPSFAPFGYKKNSSDDYYSAYNSIKHDRAKNSHKANLNILIRSMGALYVLLTYFYGSRINSTIFSASVADAKLSFLSDFGMDFSSDLDRSIFLTLYDWRYYDYKEAHGETLRGLIETIKRNGREDAVRKIARFPRTSYDTIFRFILRNSSEGISMPERNKLARSLLADGLLKELEMRTKVNYNYERIYAESESELADENETYSRRICDNFDDHI
ncbi:MAG: hypothetical protein ACK5MU_03945 [Candidatus Saccharimonadales bacterium]